MCFCGELAFVELSIFICVEEDAHTAQSGGHVARSDSIIAHGSGDKSFGGAGGELERNVVGIRIVVAAERTDGFELDADKSRFRRDGSNKTFLNEFGDIVAVHRERAGL